MPALLLAISLATPAAAAPAAAPPSVELRWQLIESAGADAGSRVSFTLTNRGAQALPASGWALYYSALHEPGPGSVGSGFRWERVVGDLQRLVPGPGFPGLAPGASVEIAYRAGHVTNRSFAPAGPYLVFDAAPERGLAIADYAVLPWDDGKGAVTPDAQYALDAVIRDIPAAELPLVFPTPLGLTRGEGGLRLAAPPRIDAPPALQSEATLAQEYLRAWFGRPRKGASAVPLRLELGSVEGQSSPEAYTLVVDAEQGIRIVGVSPAGVFYGLQSLRSLLPAPAPEQGVILPELRVVDAPRFGYRGFMLDVARNFQPKARVLAVLDVMARYKLNVLHFHLTEDEGWRLEIAGLPELTGVGSRRGHTLDSSRFLPPAYGSGPDVDRPWGSGHYTRADYVEILRYAAARHIEVVPELEMPGHARAAVKAMEARYRALAATGELAEAGRYRLIDPADSSVYTSAQLYHDNVMNPALESTYAFIEHVVAEVAALHRDAGVPLRHLHMGGDEVPAGVWQGSPAVADYLKRQALASVDELWFVFYGRVERMLNERGIGLSGWEEIAVRKTRRDGQPTNIPNPDFAARGIRAYVWNNVPGWGAEDLAYRLANGGFEVVLCPVTNLYFDLAWNPNPEERGLDWGGFVDLRKPFQFIPFDYYRNVRLGRDGRPLDPAVFVGKERLTEYGQANVVGLQGNLWSETLGGDGRLELMLLPKLLGLAERAWAPQPDWAKERDPQKAEPLYGEAWSRFVNVLGKRELPRLDRAGVRYRIPTPGLAVRDGAVVCSVELPGLELRYTTDGSEPGPRSPVVRGPIPLRGTLSVAAFDTTGRKGHTARISVP